MTQKDSALISTGHPDDLSARVVTHTKPTKENVKQKSAMSLVNELARFHGTELSCRVVSQSGPPHDRKYHVQLQLGQDKLFDGVGKSIRKAQHSAAMSALTDTSLKNQITKPRKVSPRNNNNTPAAELNVLAMKKGLAVAYEVTDLQTIFSFDVSQLHDKNCDSNGKRLHPGEKPYKAVATIGDMTFTGSGMSPQGARHSAAQKALYCLRDRSEPQKLIESSTEESSDAGKSPVSQVHELAVRMGNKVRYEVVSGSGPDHVPNYVVRCIFLNFVCEGQGTSKKAARREAAAKMVLLLQPDSNLRQSVLSNVNHCQIVEPSQQSDPVIMEKESVVLKPVRQLISPSTSISEDDKDHPVHPVNKLSMLTRMQRKTEPRYLVIYERCVDKKRKEFVVECSVRDPGVRTLAAVGIDPVQKVAKKKAAEAMIQLILTGRCSPEIFLPPKPLHPPILKTTSCESEKSASEKSGRQRRVSFTDRSSGLDRRQGKKFKKKDTDAAGLFLKNKTENGSQECPPETDSSFSNPVIDAKSSKSDVDQKTKFKNPKKNCKKECNSQSGLEVSDTRKSSAQEYDVSVMTLRKEGETVSHKAMDQAETVMLLLQLESQKSEKQ